jgi:hypothetical protein
MVLQTPWINDYAISSSLFALIGIKVFLFLVSLNAIRHGRTLFLSWHGWSHRSAGASHLCWLAVGAWTAAQGHSMSFYVFYDMVLGCLGLLATLTAARDFPHKHVSNPTGQSGTLHRKAMVTQAEMVEHAFYQGLNLWQALYLHALSHCEDCYIRMALLWLVTAPWLFRHRLPVHSFSHNWKVYQTQQQQQVAKSIQNTEDVEILLYRIKKAQYLFYKHVILHGVNISLAVAPPTTEIPYSTCWRVFWVLLNTSYVMEFFLQTMVKRKLLDQSAMLWLQRGLMLASSLGAFVVLQQVHVGICALSLALNFVHRRHDVLNTVCIAGLASFWNQLWEVH